MITIITTSIITIVTITTIIIAIITLLYSHYYYYSYYSHDLSAGYTRVCRGMEKQMETTSSRFTVAFLVS